MEARKRNVKCEYAEREAAGGGADEKRVETIHRWERGARRPSFDNLISLSKLFHCAAEEFHFSTLDGRKKGQSNLPIQERNALAEEYLNLVSFTIKKNKTLVLATRMEYADLFQDLALRLMQAVSTYNPEKGKLKTHILKALQWELQDCAQRASARGIAAAPRDLHPVVLSVDALMDAGVQI